MTAETLPTTHPGGSQDARSLVAYRQGLSDQLKHHILTALRRSDGQAVFRIVGGQLTLDDIYDTPDRSRADEVDDVVAPLTVSPAKGVTVTLDPVDLFGAALLDIAHEPDGAVLTIDVGVLAVRAVSATPDTLGA